jgi:hypothetical protein
VDLLDQSPRSSRVAKAPGQLSLLVLHPAQFELDHDDVGVSLIAQELGAGLAVVMSRVVQGEDELARALDGVTPAERRL